MKKLSAKTLKTVSRLQKCGALKFIRQHLGKSKASPVLSIRIGNHHFCENTEEEIWLEELAGTLPVPHKNQKGFDLHKFSRDMMLAEDQRVQDARKLTGLWIRKAPFKCSITSTPAKPANQKTHKSKKA